MATQLNYMDNILEGLLSGIFIIALAIGFIVSITYLLLKAIFIFVWNAPMNTINFFRKTQ